MCVQVFWDQFHEKKCPDRKQDPLRDKNDQK